MVGKRHQGEKWHRLHLRLSTITIHVGGDAPLVLLPEAIASAPVGSLASLRLDDVHRLLADHGVEMTRDDDQLLSRVLDHVRIHVMSFDGLVRRIEATWRRPADMHPDQS